MIAEGRADYLDVKKFYDADDGDGQIPLNDRLNSNSNKNQGHLASEAQSGGASGVVVQSTNMNFYLILAYIGYVIVGLILLLLIGIIIDEGSGPHGGQGAGVMGVSLAFVGIVVAVISQILYWIGGGTGLPFLPDFFS